MNYRSSELQCSKTEYTERWNTTFILFSELIKRGVNCRKWKKIVNLVLSFTLMCNLYVMNEQDRLCGLVVSIEDYKHRGPEFDSRALLRIFLRELGLERGPLSLVIG
jgi:hypothetical protein